MNLGGFIQIPVIVLILIIAGGVAAVYNNSQQKEATVSSKEATFSPSPSEKPLKPYIKPHSSSTPNSTVKPSPSPIITELNNPNSTPTSSQSSVKLDSISPNPTKYGDTVTIKGSGFGSSVQRVSFTNPQGFNTLVRIISWSDSEIKAFVPPTNGENKVQIETSSKDKSNVYNLQVTAGQPYFGSITPANVKPGGEVIIQGDGFGDGTGTVNFYKPDNISSASGGSVIYSWSNTQIRANVPGIIAPNQEYGIQIETSNGRKSSFKYYQVGN